MPGVTYVAIIVVVLIVVVAVVVGSAASLVEVVTAFLIFPLRPGANALGGFRSRRPRLVRQWPFPSVRAGGW